jgi:hypothetical protein
MESILLKSETVRRIGLDPFDHAEINLMKYAEVQCHDQLAKYGAVFRPQDAGLDLSKSTHRMFLSELQKADDIRALPQSAGAYDAQLAPSRQPSGFFNR